MEATTNTTAIPTYTLYTASSLSRTGRRVHTTGRYPTREEAVAAAFAAKPNCTVSSCRGFGNDIRFHQPENWGK